MTKNNEAGHCLIAGQAEGEVLYTDVPLSFWMGIDIATGEVIDRHHPLCGISVKNRVLVLPGGRGSCSGSCGLVELIMAGTAPAALVFEIDEPILALGGLVSQEVFGKTIPMASVGPTWFRRLATTRRIAIELDRVIADGDRENALALSTTPPTLVLSATDRAMLAGDDGKARQLAMRIVQRFADVVGAHELIDVTQAHIDCCFYTGPAGLAFAERMAEAGAKVRIPATTNATSVDRARWRSRGIDPALGRSTERVAAAYVSMGMTPSFTCAPYLLDTAPAEGAQIAWGESNAVAFANSVIGARTMKYPDFLDVCAALTGRAPFVASHTAEGRRATVRIDVAALPRIDDSFYPLLGYHVGGLAGHDIPVITGLERAAPDRDDLKAFSAAFATTSAAPMFHIVGVTPEASSVEAVADCMRLRTVNVSRDDLEGSWRELNSAEEPGVGLVALGNPHFSLQELARTAKLCRGRTKAESVRFSITCGRDVYAQAAAAGHVTELEQFGAELSTDTCWCMVDARQVADASGPLMTNSAKFAHYGPGITGRRFHFASLTACVNAAASGRHEPALPAWLS
ncbi:MAG: aconitase family protein [Hyphomicrobiales bacterium]